MFYWNKHGAPHCKPLLVVFSTALKGGSHGEPSFQVRWKQFTEQPEHISKTSCQQPGFMVDVPGTFWLSWIPNFQKESMFTILVAGAGAPPVFAKNWHPSTNMASLKRTQNCWAGWCLYIYYILIELVLSCSITSSYPLVIWHGTWKSYDVNGVFQGKLPEVERINFPLLRLIAKGYPTKVELEDLSQLGCSIYISIWGKGAMTCHNLGDHLIYGWRETLSLGWNPQSSDWSIPRCVPCVNPMRPASK